MYETKVTYGDYISITLWEFGQIELGIQNEID